MKKISIILSTVVAASLLALASCSNVTELNGNQYESYKAGASGQTLAQAEAAAAAEAAKTTFTITGSVDSQAIKPKEVKLTTFDTLPATIEVEIADGNKVTTETGVAAGTLTFTLGGGTYKNNAAAKDATKVTFRLVSGTVVTDLTAAVSIS